MARTAFHRFSARNALRCKHAGRSCRVDFATLDRLLTYFHRTLRVTMDDLLAWEPTPEGETAAAVA